MNLPRSRLHLYAAFSSAASFRFLASNSSGLRFPSAECMRTLLKKHSMCSNISSVDRSLASRVRALGFYEAHERLRRCVAPRRRYESHRGLDAGAAHGPAQKRGDVPAAVIRGDLDRSAIMRDHMPMTIARCGRPWRVPT